MTEAAAMTFETAMERLQEVVEALESGELSLESSLALYKEGNACAVFCREKLKTARQELEIWQDGMAVPADEPEEEDE